jgi:hypothetical protein
VAVAVDDRVLQSGTDLRRSMFHDHLPGYARVFPEIMRSLSANGNPSGGAVVAL